MAGTILISEGVSVALNSFGYDVIIEATRAEFDEQGAQVRSEVYEGNDLACMNFISVSDQDVEGFRTFETAARVAYGKAVQDGRSFAEWDELMAKLAADARSRR